MKRIALVLLLAAQLPGCAHGGQIKQNAKQTGIYLGMMAALITLMVVSGCDHCHVDETPDTGVRP